MMSSYNIFIIKNITILLTSTVVYTLLPKKTFNTGKQLTLIEALYFASTTHTALGFGDIYPITTIGRICIMIHIMTVFFIITIN